NKELDELDIKIAKREKLRRLELIDYEFQHKKEILDIDKQTKLAELHAQELANIEKEKELATLEVNLVGLCWTLLPILQILQESDDLMERSF
ncbi:1141_t:CDS:2, partial [Gigaspora rosea]